MRIARLIPLPLFFFLASAYAAPPTIGGCPVFPADNAWNTPVDKLPVHPSSTTWVNTIGASSNFHPDFGTFWQGAPIGIPYITVPGSQPTVPIVFGSEAASESDPGPYPIPPNAPIEGGPSSSGDRHVLVVETGTCTLYELFSAYPQNGGASWTAYSGAKWSLHSNAMRPDTWTSADAAGLPILPGLVRRDEVLAGEINHALRFTAPQTLGAYVWPARHEASSLTGSQYPPLGARFRLKASFDISGFSPQNQVILRALKKYGMLLADNGSPWYVSGEHNPAWDDNLLGELKTLDGSDFEAVDGASLRISANSGKALQPPPAVTLREVASGLTQPVAIAHAPDGSGRLFIVEKGGIIKILKNGAVLPTPFLNVSTNVSTSSERGLLGLAFDPHFATSKRFLVFYTMVADGSLRVSQYFVTGGNPDIANPLTEVPVITIAHPGFDNHNGGSIAFGNDGYLYIATGDGGGGGDQANNAQQVNNLLGKMLRLDVGAIAGWGGYGIPTDNPLILFGLDEIWAYGLRNPWRFSFDRASGDMYIGDVGQGAVEEIDFVPNGWLGGPNFGWRQFEGNQCYNPATGCSAPNYTPPVLTYGRDASGGQSVTGGYMYRGRRSAALRGYYVFGDFIASRVWAMAREGGGSARFVLYEPPGGLSGVSSFGEDESGEVYVASFNNGRVYAIDGPTPGVRGAGMDFNGDSRGDVIWKAATGGDLIGWQLGGSGRYTRGDAFHPSIVVDTEILSAGAGYQPRQVADFNGDGRTDILWRGTDGSYRVQLMSGLAGGTPSNLLGPGTGWEAVGQGDFNGDGKIDLLWKHTNGTYGAWLMNGGAIASAGVIFYGGDGLELTHVADFNGDGKADLLGKYPDGSVRLWLMDGMAGFAAATLVGPSVGGWLPVFTGDLNGDGRADIVWKHSNGSYGGWLMNGIFADAYGAIFYGGSGLELTHVADFDGDGKADLLGKYPDGSVRAWLMNGLMGTAAATLSPAGAGWLPVRVEDYNRDGRADVIVKHTSGAHNIWIMNGVSAPAVGNLTFDAEYSLVP